MKKLPSKYYIKSEITLNASGGDPVESGIYALELLGRGSFPLKLTQVYNF